MANGKSPIERAEIQPFSALISCLHEGLTSRRMSSFPLENNRAGRAKFYSKRDQVFIFKKGVMFCDPCSAESVTSFLPEVGSRVLFSEILCATKDVYVSAM